MKKLTNDELHRINIDTFKKVAKNPIVLLLDNIRSLNNIGSIFRTADAFRIESIYLCGITATPPHREIQKTALGATESVEWKYYENVSEAIFELKQNKFKIIAVEQADMSIKLNDFKPEINEKYALIFGNEINGVSTVAIDLSDACIEIPQFGTKHSFNVTITTGIILWDILLKMKLL